MSLQNPLVNRRLHMSTQRALKLDEVFAAAGGISALSRAMGISRQAIGRWTRIPAERVVEVEHATGIDRERLRPDLYRRKG